MSIVTSYTRAVEFLFFKQDQYSLYRQDVNFSEYRYRYQLLWQKCQI